MVSPASYHQAQVLRDDFYRSVVILFSLLQSIKIVDTILCTISSQWKQCFCSDCKRWIRYMRSRLDDIILKKDDLCGFKTICLASNRWLSPNRIWCSAPWWNLFAEVAFLSYRAFTFLHHKWRTNIAHCVCALQHIFWCYKDTLFELIKLNIEWTFGETHRVMFYWNVVQVQRGVIFLQKILSFARFRHLTVSLYAVS